MQAGHLRHRITIERPGYARDAAGSEYLVWESYATVWGSLVPLRGRESEGSGHILADLDTEITIRWSPRVAVIDAKWRVRHGGTTYNVGAPPVLDEQGRRSLRILCRSGVNDG